MNCPFAIKLRKAWTTEICLECLLCYDQSPVRSSTTKTTETRWVSIGHGKNIFCFKRSQNKSTILVTQEITIFAVTGYLSSSEEGLKYGQKILFFTNQCNVPGQCDWLGTLQNQYFHNKVFLIIILTTTKRTSNIDGSGRLHVAHYTVVL